VLSWRDGCAQCVFRREHTFIRQQNR
jgi:hypothetical protein